jgi:hypothetical protein
MSGWGRDRGDRKAQCFRNVNCFQWKMFVVAKSQLFFVFFFAGALGDAFHFVSDLNWLLKKNKFETAIHAFGVKKNL